MSSIEPVASSTSLLSSLPSNFWGPVSIGTAWFVSSAVLTTYSTNAFLEYSSDKEDRLSSKLPLLCNLSRPTLLTLYRFAGSLMLGLLLHPDLNVLSRVQRTVKSVPDLLIPAIFLFTANLSNSIALKRIGIPLTYTSKCGIVLITAILTLLLDGWQALPGNMGLLSLLPIAFGIAAASWNAPTFDLIGFIAAGISATAQSALNISSKKIMKRLSMSGQDTQRTMVLVGLILSTATMLVKSLGSKSNEEEDNALPPAWLSVSAFTAYHFEYLLSFTFVPLVSPITYGTVDAIRRLAIIVCGKLFFGGPKLTHLNILGIFLALCGAFSYSVFANI